MNYNDIPFSNSLSYYNDRSLTLIISIMILQAKYREKMINRVHKGVPDSVRGRFWYILLDLDNIKRQQVRK